MRSKYYDSTYRFIVQYKREHDGNAPTLREICTAVKCNSTSVIAGVIHRLEEDNKLRKVDGKICITSGRWGMAV